ncbi:MAG: pyridoxamine 5'-phosphate oxidase family protein [Acidimicrobiales bacterium]
MPQPCTTTPDSKTTTVRAAAREEPEPATARRRPERTAVHRRPERAAYDETTVHAVLDEALFCHVGVVRDGAPVVIPTIHARDGRALCLHGSPAAGILRDARRGVDVCVTVSIVDGLVLARSAFHHSLNYRSVVIFGHAERVRDPRAKARALDHIVEHVVPGRLPSLRPTSPAELRETEVLRLPLTEASAKVRTGPPIDADEDLAFPVWAGVLPLITIPGVPLPDAHVAATTALPAHAEHWARPGTPGSAGEGAARSAVRRAGRDATLAGRPATGRQRADRRR